MRKKKMTQAERLKYYPQEKKGCLRPPGSQGKGDADSRTSPAARRPKLAKIFGEKHLKCFRNSKEQMADGSYWCEHCKERFTAL